MQQRHEEDRDRQHIRASYNRRTVQKLEVGDLIRRVPESSTAACRVDRWELDPDLRLYLRLSLGGGWQLVATLVLWIALLGAFATGIVGALPLLASLPALNMAQRASRGVLLVGLVFLVFAPARAVARLLEHERTGLLDQMRLCGRRPSEMLATCLAGSLLPFIAVSAALLGAHVRLDGDPWFALLGVLVLCAALDVALLVYAGLAPELAPDPQLTTPILLVIGLIAVVALQLPGWVQRRTFVDRRAMATVAAVVALMPAAWWLASRRIRRPTERARRAASDFLIRWLHIVPVGGPPEARTDRIGEMVTW